MKQRKQLSLKLMAWFLCLAMLFGMMPLSVFAAEREGVVYRGNAYYVNPLYADIVSEEDFAAVGHAPTYNALIEDEGIQYATTIEEAADIMREGMMNREETFCVNVRCEGNISYEQMDILDEQWMNILYTAIAHDMSNPAGGDYLAFQFGGVGVNFSWQNKSGYCYINYEFYVTYYTTAAQEAIVDAQVAMVLDSLNLDGKSDVEKVQAIYDWMTENIYYDNENLNNDSYLLQYTAYAALVNKTSVCQGYANLLYRFLLEEGIDCRIISGIGGGGPHAWNIIGLDGLYYNADATWDATYAQAGMKYAYFLRCEDNFSDHIRDEEFLTSQFLTQYPMANSDYIFGGHSHTWNEGVVLVEPTEYSEGVLEYICTGCGETKTEVIPKLEHVHVYIVEVIAPDCVTEGYTLHTCACGASYKDGYVAFLGHDYKLQNAVEPTCTAEGYTGDEVCQRCDAIIYAGQIIPAKGHSFIKGECTVCGEADPDYKDPTPDIPEHEHSYIEYVVVPNCTEDGYTVYECSCGVWYIGNYVEATGHEYVRVYVIEATCIDGGYSYYECSCGDSYLDDFVYALGHDFVKGECTVCGEADPDYVEPTPTPGPATNPFVDVGEKDYFYAPVLWAVEEGITGGMDATHFAPNNACTRGQVVTFLWRANGSPEPKSTSHPFTDISADKYYYKAVLWAVEEGITAGLTATTFGPNNACTRGQIATFLWRANGSPEPQSNYSPFYDVTGGPFYKAILWAVENGITTGYAGGTFRPGNVCTRGNIVTFLYRSLNPSGSTPIPIPTPTPTPTPEVATVWVTKSGTKYHASANCSNMKAPIAMSMTQALEKGYSACKKCW